MENIKVVEAFQTQSDMNEGAPNVDLLKIGVVFLVGHYFLIEISIVEELHDNTR